MKKRRYLWILIIGLFLTNYISSQTEDSIPINITRISDRVLVLNGSFMENNVVALATKKGLVVVDSTGIPSIARKMRKIIEKEFGRSDFNYLINTHFHWDHSWGNMAFPEAKTVGHEGCVPRMRRDETQMANTIASFKRNILASKERLKKVEPGSEEERTTRTYLSEAEMAVVDYSEGFKMVPPMISFNDRMTIELGDLTLELVYFGRSHSGADIFIHIPEENLLLTGDIFLDGRWVPLFSTAGPLDIPRWIEVLNGLLAEDNIKQVIPGHQHLWPRERLELWRDYIVDLWKGVNAAKKQGLSINQVLERFPLENKYLYLKDLGHTDDELKNFQERNVRSFWRQLLESADQILEKSLEDGGIKSAQAKFAEIKKGIGQDYYIDEQAINALGYRLLNRRLREQAIEIFKMNVELFPDSWNVHDSLGEALWQAEKIKEAYASYKKAQDLGSQNPQAEIILDKLRKLIKNTEIGSAIFT